MRILATDHPTGPEYAVLDASGNIVRRGYQLIKSDGMGNAVIIYEELCDLPIGEYVIQPGDIGVEIRPRS